MHQLHHSVALGVMFVVIFLPLLQEEDIFILNTSCKALIGSVVTWTQHQLYTGCDINIISNKPVFNRLACPERGSSYLSVDLKSRLEYFSFVTGKLCFIRVPVSLTASRRWRWWWCCKQRAASTVVRSSSLQAVDQQIAQGKASQKPLPRSAHSQRNKVNVIINWSLRGSCFCFHPFLWKSYSLAFRSGQLAFIRPRFRSVRRVCSDLVSYRNPGFICLF